MIAHLYVKVLREVRSYAEKLGESPHRSFFRRAVAVRASVRPVSPGEDPVHEYLIDQANLRGYLGAYSDRDDRGELDPSLSIEEILVGLLQPHAPAELRLVKLVVRALQSGNVDINRLLFLSKRERALPVLAWIIELIPSEEQTPSIGELQQRLRDDPPRDRKRPNINYTSDRLRRL